MPPCITTVSAPKFSQRVWPLEACSNEVAEWFPKVRPTNKLSGRRSNPVPTSPKPVNCAGSGKRCAHSIVTWASMARERKRSNANTPHVQRTFPFINDEHVLLPHGHDRSAGNAFESRGRRLAGSFMRFAIEFSGVAFQK
jgi:hypothetical protein